MTPLELERLVLMASNVTSSQQQQQHPSDISQGNNNQWEATSLLNKWVFEGDSTNVTNTLLEAIQTSQHQHVIFYALTTFQRPDIMAASTLEQRISLRNFLLSSSFPTTTLTFLRTKFAVVLAQLIRVDFPHGWADAFDELQQQQQQQDLFFRTLDALMEDFEYNADDITTHLKDAMRGLSGNSAPPSLAASQTISARLLNTLLGRLTQAYQQRDEGTMLLALNVLKRFISWIDMALVLEDRVLTLIFMSLQVSPSSSDVGVSAMECLQGMVARGMDSDKKVALLVDTDMLRKIHAHVNLETVDASPIEVVIEVAKLIDMTGLELMPLIEDPASIMVHQNSSLLQTQWPQLVDLFFRCFAYDDIDVSGAVIPFASRLATAIGKERESGVALSPHLPRLLGILYRQMRYPPDYSFDHEDEDEAEEEVYRSELRKLFQRLVRVCPELCLQFLCEALANLPVPISTSPTPDVEAALRLMYHYCEGIRPPPGMKVAMKNETFRAIIVALHGSDITSHPHREVLLLYYDVAVRYYPIFLDRPELLPEVLQGMSGPCGLQHPHPRVRSRSSYFLLRLVKSIIKVMRPFVETAVTGIQGLLSNPNQYPLRPEDALYLFETIGLLLGKTGLAPSEQRHSLASVMTPHIRSMEETLRSENLSRDPEYFGESLAGSIAAIAYLSKGFSKPPLEVQMVLVETVSITLAVLEALPGNNQVRGKTMISLQRMILCLGTKILPTIPQFLHVLIENCNGEDIQDVAQLFNQLCLKFKEEAAPAIDPAILPFLRKCHSLIPTVGDVVAGGNDVPPHLRAEQLSIKKLTFTVLQHIATYHVTAVLVSPTNASSFENVLHTMSDGASLVEDPIVKKACLMFFRELVEQWSAPDGSLNANGSSSMLLIHGFFRFTLEIFIPAMVKCILGPSFDEQDALQARNIAELSQILFSLKAKARGSDEFDHVILNGFLSRVGCPPNLIEAFRTATTTEQVHLCLMEMLKMCKHSNAS